MRMAGYLALALVVLSVMAEAESSRDRPARSSAQTEPIRRRGNLSQRGRRKNIWSYNPGHRSLAFLIAGEVEVASPPPVESITGAEYRCLGCCGEKAPFGDRTTSSPQPFNRVGRIVLRPDGLAMIGTEPNSVIGRCLGCCEDSVTPTNGVTTVTTMTTRSPTTTKAMSVRKFPMTIDELIWKYRPGNSHLQSRVYSQRQPSRRYDSSSSSEEIPRVTRPPPRRRKEPIRSRKESRCRHVGCRSPLGSVVDDSSSSEED